MSTRVRRANKATSSQLSSVLPKVFDLKGSRCTTQVSTSSELLDVDRQSVWELLEQNMRHMYVGSSMGWDPPSKKEELFHRNSRFILLRRSQVQDDADVCGEPSIVAYSMFRFEMENDERVLYCYELQVVQDVRRGGIGKTLVQCLCNIAREWDMQKVMLTVFKENQMALLFYKAMGFIADSDSNLDHEDDVDYWIMSKDTGVTCDA
ncbi:acyl-CoA N-acyltransferase [Lactarius akahatsu]|uniref:N-alpha-acetyltransferase 40 n=1 Tax=Lactarius akahatsu TaxID=416441 RepID=A0AAD4LEM5_9AGAM|nr:acyl-CoA N-acyltransferase [Lactarius akahatsu]